VRTAKYGLKQVARNTKSTNTLYGIFGLNTEIGGLLQGLQPYLLGYQLNQDLLQSTFTSLGGVAYFVMVLAQNLKVKVPGAGRMRRLHDITKTEALLRLNTLAVDLLYHGMSAFNGAEINKEAVSEIVAEVIALLWPLTYDMLGVPPADVFEDYSARLAAGFPEGLFAKDVETYRAAQKALKEKETAELAYAAEQRKAKVVEPEAAAA
jgi:hypothetical protein